MQELEVTWSRAASVAWLIFWRGLVGALVIGALQGLVIGFAMGFAGAILKNPTITSLVPWVTATTGAIVGFVWFVVVVRMALEKSYRAFRITLVPTVRVGL